MPIIDMSGSGAGNGGSDKSAARPGDLNESMKELVATVKRLDSAMKKLASDTGRRPELVDQYGTPMAAKEQRTRTQTAAKAAREQATAAAQQQKLAEQTAAKAARGQATAAAQQQKLAEQTAAKKIRDEEKAESKRVAVAYRQLVKEQQVAERAAARAEVVEQRAYTRAYKQRNRVAASAMSPLEAPESAFASGRSLRSWQNRQAMGGVGQQAWAPGLGGSMMGALRVGGAVLAAGMEAPFLPGQIMNGILSTAQPAIDLTKGSYALGRAGGFSGAGLFNTLYPGTGTTKGTEWMSDNMLTPSKVLESMGSYGIAPRSADQTKEMALAFARSNLSGGFSGMAPGTAERLARQGVGYGSAPNTPGGVAGFLGPIETTMADAVAKGMDRTKVLSSIQDSLDIMARAGGIGASAEAATSLINRLMQSGTAGGRTGQTALEIQSTMAGFVNNPSSQPVGQMMMYSQMPKFGMLKTREGIEKFLGPNVMRELDKSPGVRDSVIEDALKQAQSGNTAMAMNTLTKAMGPDSERTADIIRQGVEGSGMPKEMRRAALSGATGLPLMDIYAAQAGRMAGPSEAAKGDQIQARFSESVDSYKEKLRAAGVPATVAAALVSAGQRKNVNPMLLASIAKQESGYRQTKDGKTLLNPESGAAGLMQIMPQNGKYPAGVKQSLEENALVGAGILADQLKAHGGDVDKALAGYGGFKTKDPSSYVGSVSANYHGLSGRSNVPTDIGRVENLAAQETIGGANFSLNNFVTKAEKLTTGMERAGDAAVTFADKLTASYKRLDEVFKTTQGNRGGGMFDVDGGKRASGIWNMITGSSNGSPHPAGQ